MQIKARENIEEIRNMIEPYCIAKKLIEPSFSLTINENDYGIYDAWEPSPPSYSFILGTIDNPLKISINTEDGEIIIDLRSNNEKLKNFLEEIDNECRKLNLYRDPNRISTSFNDRGLYFAFHGYFYNRKDYAYNILKHCLVLNN